MKCPNCGTEIADTAKFCRKCGAKIEVEETPEQADEHVFEEPVDTEDGSVEFNWDQPVEIEEPAAAEEDADKVSEAEAEDGSAGDDESYEWGPPTGGESDQTDDTMMPVAFAGRGSALEKTGERKDFSGEASIPDWDHTHEFDPEDISENKDMAMAPYALGPLGVIIALIAGKESPYARFHMRQGLKIAVLEGMIALIMMLFCWTLIVPAVGIICMFILMVIQIIAFLKVCRGRAEEPPIVRSLKILK